MNNDIFIYTEKYNDGSFESYVINFKDISSIYWNKLSDGLWRISYCIQGSDSYYFSGKDLVLKFLKKYFAWRKQNEM